MVAISLYKGNLHRSPGATRQWLRPTRKISFKDFKTLIHRRSIALARLQPSTSKPNPNSDHSGSQSNGILEVVANDANVDGGNLADGLADSNAYENGKKGSDDDLSVIPSEELVAREVADAKAVLPANDSMDGHQQQATLEDQLAPSKDDSLNNKEKRKKEVEEKLKVLNERKHKLVQVLKQILNAEEELRRRNNVTGRPFVSLQVDVTNDSGSMSRHVTPRPGSEGAEVGGTDADDMSNHNVHSRNMTRMSSMSPSSDCLPRRAPISMIAPNPSRGGIVTSSPSRFAPASNGQQGGSVSGTNYVGSSPSPSPSPSPAGSGGTSVFRDAIASPWN